MSLLEEALAASECVISVMGPHAGEHADAIFRRKIADCHTVGWTLWVAKSAKARPAHVQAMCESHPGYVIFVEPSTPGGARPTTQSQMAIEYSSNRVSWIALPREMSPVTGQMDRLATALVFDGLTTDVQSVIDLWNYADYLDTTRPLTFTLGRSTACAVRTDTSAHPERMKSRHRGIVAVGRLAEPYSAWVR